MRIKHSNTFDSTIAKIQQSAPVVGHIIVSFATFVLFINHGQLCLAFFVNMLSRILKTTPTQRVTVELMHLRGTNH